MHYCASLDLVILIHCEDDAIIKYCIKKHNYSSKRPKNSEENSVFTVANYALLTKCKTYFSKITCSKSLDIIKGIRARGGKVFVETCPHYMFLNSSIYMNSSLKESTKYLVYPPLREIRDNKALIKAALEGTIDLIASDHYSCSYKDHKIKYYNNEINEAKGIPGIQLRPSLIYKILVKENDLPVEDFVRLMSYSPSRIFSLYDRGYIREGGAGDIVIWSEEKFKVSQSELSEAADYTPYEGMELIGRPQYVIG